MGNQRHIFFFIDSLSGGGAERVCALLANSLSARHHKVTVVTIKAAVTTDYQLSPQVDRISIFANRKSNNTIAALKNNLAQASQLRKLVKRQQPDIVVSFMTQSNVVCGLACANLKTIHIASERNYPPLQTIGRVWNILRKYLYQLPEVIVSQTQKANTWIAENTKCRNTTVIPNPVVYPLQSSASQNHSAITVLQLNKSKVILGVGRLVDQKQFDHLIRTFSTFAMDYTDWVLIIIGDGPNRIGLQQQIEALTLQNRILLVGRQENMDYWYTLAEIFVLTSKFEGYPNALLEAMCYGVTPVSYCCDAGPESIIQHRHNGLLVPLNDEALLASNICKLIDNREFRQCLGTQAKNIQKTHSIDSITEQWELLFDSFTR